LRDGLMKLGQMLFAAGARVLYPSITGSIRITNETELADQAARMTATSTNLMTIHLFSSCPMGENLRRCATDSFGRVHGFANLYISNASLLCTAPGVNPQGSIMMIARRNALKFLDKL